MLRRYSPGQDAPAGAYLRSGTWEFVTRDCDGALPAGEDVVFYRIPILLLVFVGPLAGLLWLFVYPLVIPLALGYACWRRLTEAVPWLPKHAHVK